MIKILLMSDLHLGKNKNNENISSNDNRLSTFNKIMSLAKEHDILLIAGDLIDTAEISKENLETVKNRFNFLKDFNTQTIIYPDNIIEKLTEKENVFPDNIKILSNEFTDTPYQFKKDEETIYFYKCEDINRLFTERKKENTGFHLGLFHTNDINFVKEKIHEKNQDLPLDFYALGGDHSFNIYENHENNIIGASPGSPESSSIEETGDRYILSFSISEDKIKQINRLTVNTTTLVRKIFKCDYQTEPSIIYDYIMNDASPNTLLTLQLKGEKNFILDKNIINLHKDKYQNIIIIDETIPDINKIIDKFIHEDSFRGEFFKSLKEKLEKTKSLNNNSMENFAIILNIIANTDSKLTEEELCKLLNA